MTEREALKLALEALETGKPMFDAYWGGSQFDNAITAIKEALREHAMYEVQRLGQEIQPEQEPVAYWDDEETFVLPKQKEWDKRTGGISTFGCDTPLYTTTPQRTWVGLTDEELPPLAGDNGKYMDLQQVRIFYKYIEAKLKQKNGYAEENT